MEVWTAKFIFTVICCTARVNAFMEKRDEELILELADGRQEALEELFVRYKKPILNFALRMLGNRADAEDVTADVFMALFIKHHTYKPSTKFSTWLFAIARNSAVDRIRKRKRSLTLWFKQDEEESQWDIEDSRPGPAEQAVKREEKFIIRRAIKKLPENQREALILREYHQMSYSDISAILNCSLEQVKITIYRAREQLKAIFPSLNDEDTDE